MTFRTTIALLAALISCVTAHSNLGSPLAYNPTACKASEEFTCDGPNGPCPKIYRSGKLRARNSEDSPAATWQRGQAVEIVWHKNNHIGGFYRRSLVPVEHMTEHSWHKKTAFDFGCWSQGSFQCGQSDKCGADQKGRAYKNTVVIPAVFPDGDYVFGQVWYGGLHWRGLYPKYSDYFACSFVRIRGGVPLQKSAAVTFTGPEKKCASGSTRPLECGGESCGDKCGLESCPEDSVKVTVPDEFKDGAIPKVFLANIDPAAAGGANAPAPVEPVVVSDDIAADAVIPDSPTPSPSPSSSTVPVVIDDPSGFVSADSAPPSASPSPSISPISAADLAEEQKAIQEDQEDAAADEKVGLEEAVAPKPVVEGPIKSIRVFVDQEMEKELLAGEKATIALNGKGVSFEGYTDGQNVGTMYFKINGKTDRKRESSSPYVFRGNRGTVYNEWPTNEVLLNEEFSFEVVLWSGNKRYSTTVMLTLTN